jgi:probable F420-dependent oxidoreductase
MNAHSFRFGAHIRESSSAAEWREKARTVERLGYDILTMPDHFGAQLAYGPALTAAALATTTLQIGTLTLDNDFRHPAIVAGEAATLDLLSAGRYELGLGAGWMQTDYDRTGIPFDAPGTRVSRLIESVQIIKGLFGEQPVTYIGEHHTIADFSGFPRPVQRPHPPMLIGGGGRRMLAFAAQEADIVSIIPGLSAPNTLSLAELAASVVDAKIARVRAVAGERFASLELHALIQRVIVTDDRQRAVESLGAEWGVPADVAGDSPYLLIGTVEEIADTVRAHRERFGFSYLTVFERDMDQCAPVVARLAGK